MAAAEERAQQHREWLKTIPKTDYGAICDAIKGALSRSFTRGGRMRSASGWREFFEIADNAMKPFDYRHGCVIVPQNNWLGADYDVAGKPEVCLVF
jgi:hypothetical protein